MPRQERCLPGLCRECFPESFRAKLALLPRFYLSQLNTNNLISVFTKMGRKAFTRIRRANKELHKFINYYMSLGQIRIFVYKELTLQHNYKNKFQYNDLVGYRMYYLSFSMFIDWNMEKLLELGLWTGEGALASCRTLSNKQLDMISPKIFLTWTFMLEYVPQSVVFLYLITNESIKEWSLYRNVKHFYTSTPKGNSDILACLGHTIRNCIKEWRKGKLPKLKSITTRSVLIFRKEEGKGKKKKSRKKLFDLRSILRLIASYIVPKSLLRSLHWQESNGRSIRKVDLNSKAHKSKKYFIYARFSKTEGKKSKRMKKKCRRSKTYRKIRGTHQPATVAIRMDIRREKVCFRPRFLVWPYRDINVPDKFKEKD